MRRGRSSLVVVEGVAKIAGLDHGLPDANKLNEAVVLHRPPARPLNLLRVHGRTRTVGLCSQLELFQHLRDGDNWERGLFVARDLSRIEPLEHAVLAPELAGCVPFVPGEVHSTRRPFLAAPAHVQERPHGQRRGRGALEMLVELRKNKVVGVDAFDLRRWCRTPRRAGPSRRARAVLARPLQAASDLNILRQFGMLAVLEEKNELDEETEKKRLDRIASNARSSVTQYKDIVYPAFSGAAPPSAAYARRSSPPTACQPMARRSRRRTWRRSSPASPTPPNAFDCSPSARAKASTSSRRTTRRRCSLRALGPRRRASRSGASWRTRARTASPRPTRRRRRLSQDRQGMDRRRLARRRRCQRPVRQPEPAGRLRVQLHARSSRGRIPLRPRVDCSTREDVDFDQDASARARLRRPRFLSLYISDAFQINKCHDSRVYGPQHPCV